MNEIIFNDLLIEKNGLVKGPFGGDIKKSLFVKKSEDAYKVYEQGIVINQNIQYGNYYISKDHFEKKLKRFEVKAGDILITGAGTLGEVFTVPNKPPRGVINQALLRVRLNSDVISTNFFKYYFKYYIINVISKINGDSVIPNLPPLLSIRKTKIKIPKKSEQKKIEKFLDLIEEKIQINNKANQSIINLVNTIFDYWFLQFNFPNNEGKPYNYSGGKFIWNNNVKKEIPIGWNVKQLKTLISKEKSKEKIKSNEILESGKIPVIDQSTKLIAGYTNNEKSTIRVTDPVIVFGDHTRILKLINFDFARGADGTKTILSKDNCMPQNLLYLNLQKIDLSSFGYARHFKFLKSSYLVIPDEVSEKKFDAEVSSLFKKVHLNIKQNIKLKNIQNWFLPYLMEGKIKNI